MVWKAPGTPITESESESHCTAQRPAYTLLQGTAHKKSRYRPIVKFRNIESSILNKVQLGNDSPNPSSDSNIGNPVVVSDSDSDSDDDSEEPDWPATTFDTPVQPIHFDVDVDINLDSSALRDMVVTAPIIEERVTSVHAPAASESSVMSGDWRTTLDSW